MGSTWSATAEMRSHCWPIPTSRDSFIDSPKTSAPIVTPIGCSRSRAAARKPAMASVRSAPSGAAGCTCVGSELYASGKRT